MPPSRAFPWSRRFLVRTLVVFTVIGLLESSYHYLGDVTDGHGGMLWHRLVDEMTGAYAAALIFLGLRILTRELPWPTTRWTLRLPAYAAALAIGSAAKTSLQWAGRSLIYSATGIGHYSYGIISARYPMEFSNDIVILAVMIAGLTFWDRIEAGRARELQTAHLEGRLARAQLDNLRLQLQPHFLFNALNTISTAVYEDPAAADRMVTQLSELLRSSLKSSDRTMIPLADELEALHLYVALLSARFGERLRVEWKIDPGTERALVPPFLLQPLVENAVRHGGLTRTGQGVIAVAAARHNGKVALSVTDDGPGSPPGRPWGTGLRATADRLTLLHGAEAVFTAANASPTGFTARAEFPFEEGER